MPRSAAQVREDLYDASGVVATWWMQNYGCQIHTDMGCATHHGRGPTCGYWQWRAVRQASEQVAR